MTQQRPQPEESKLQPAMQRYMNDLREVMV